MEFISWIAIIALFIWVLNLSGKIKDLEGRGARGQAKEIVPDGQAQYQKELQVPLSQQAEQGAQPQVAREDGWFEKFIEWLKEEWLLKLGALLLLIGLGWFVSYAIQNGWIGPAGQIALGILASIIVVGIGEWRIRKYTHQGSIFLVLGSTGILLTIFAAREVYGMFTPLTALIVMFLSVAYVAVSSVRHRTQALALSSLILAGIAPLLTAPSSVNYIGLFSYLLVIVAGTIWVVTVTKWRNLTLASLILVTFYSFPFFLGFTSDTQVMFLIFSFIFTAIFFFTNIIGILKLQNEDLKKLKPDLVTAGGSGLFLLTWILTVAPPEWQVLIISAWMILFIVAAFIVFSITNRKEPFFVYAGVGIAMLASATAIQLSWGAALTIAYTLEGAFIIIIAHVILRDIRITERLAIIMAVPVFLSLGSFAARTWREGVFHEDFTVLALLSITLLMLGLFFLRERLLKSISGAERLATVFLVIGSIYVYALLWLSLHAGASGGGDTATMIALVIYTIFGLAAYFYGRVNDSKVVRVYGAILLGFVVGRLLFIEVWQMEMIGRIITFFLVGVLLMSTAFIGKGKKKVEIIPPEE